MFKNPKEEKCCLSLSVNGEGQEEISTYEQTDDTGLCMTIRGVWTLS